jgi:outer membrane usher protein
LKIAKLPRLIRSTFYGVDASVLGAFILLGCAALTTQTFAQTLPSPAAPAEPAAPSATASTAATNLPVRSGIRETLASVTINGLVIAENMPLLDVDRLGLLMSRLDYERLRLINARIPEVTRGDEDWVALGRVKGMTVALNARTLSLDLNAQPDLFARTNINVVEAPKVVLSPIPLGAYVNYDVVADSVRGVKSIRGLFEGVLFSNYGSLVSNHLYSHTAANPLNSFSQATTLNTRLDTYFQKDFLDTTTRLKVGDAIVNPGSWGRALRIGGLQISTDFSLSPRFISSPLLDFRGQASVPSIVDLYVNNNLVRRFDVAPGPFSIAQIPVISGTGEARIVVRDALGKDVTITQPFFNAPAQLRAGLSQYSFEVGALRRLFALESSQYGAPVAAGTYRYGVNDKLTIEGRFESLLRAENGLNKLSVVGLSAVMPFENGHYLAPSVAMSTSELGSGTQVGIQYGYSGTSLFYGLRAERSTSSFRQLGFVNGELPQDHNYSASVGVRLSSGALSLALTDTLPRPFTIATGALAGTQVGGTRTQVGTLSYSTSFGGGWSMAAGVTRVVSGSSSNLAFLTMNYSPTVLSYLNSNVSVSKPDGSKSTVSASVRAGERASDLGGLGYEVEASNTRERASVSAITRAGEFGADVAYETKSIQGQSQVSGRLAAKGSIAVTGEGVMPARPITNTFVVVSAPAMANSPVRTTSGAGVTLDGSGRAILTRVAPYDATEIQVLPETTPLEVTIDRFSTRVTPGAKAGVIARLEVRRTRAVTLRLIDASGVVLPTGTTFDVFDNETKTKTESGSLGLDGLLYIKDLPQSARVFARRAGQSCDLKLPSVPKETIPDLGDVQCVFQ